MAAGGGRRSWGWAPGADGGVAPISDPIEPNWDECDGFDESNPYATVPGYGRNSLRPQPSDPVQAKARATAEADGGLLLGGDLLVDRHRLLGDLAPGEHPRALA